MKLKLIHLELFLYVIFCNTYINLIGSISISEIWVLIVTPSILRKNIYTTYPILRKITLIFIVYFAFQILSEIIVNNDFNNASRGIMTTVVCYFSMLYLFDRLHKHYSLIIFFLLFITIRNILYVNSVGLGEDGVEFGIESNSFFKFKITPILSSFIFCVSFFLLKRSKKKLTIVLIVILMLLYVSFSARSAALGLFFYALMLIVGEKMTKNKRRIIPGLLVVLSMSYLSYAYWVNYQLTGNLKIKNEQIYKLKNPYNPLEMLSQGRTEFFVGVSAFQDQFLWGNGAWAIDKTFKYQRLMEKIKNEDFSGQTERTLIPSHSIIMGAAVANGVFAFLSMCWLIFFVLKLQLSIFSFMIKTPFAVIYLSLITGLLWTAFFSPLAHLRLEIPFIFACTLVFFNESQNLRRRRDMLT